MSETNNEVSKNPSGVHAVTPHLVCRNAAEAIEFYRKAFGATEVMRMPMPDGSGKLMHAMIRIGDSPVMMMDESPQWDSIGPQDLKASPVTLHLHVNDIDNAYQRAVDAGATAQMPPQDMFWGDRYGVLRDPFGHSWAMSTRIREMSPEETMEAAKRAMASPETVA